MKRLFKPFLIMSLGLCLFACSKKNYTSKTSSRTKTNPNKTELTNRTTTVSTTTEYKQQIRINLDFGDYNTYYVDEKYIGWHNVEEITKDCFPFDLDWTLRDFKGWSYNDEIIFDESGNKVKDFEIAESMTFDVVFEPIEELKMFDYSASFYHSFDIYGFANNDPDYLLSITSVEIAGTYNLDNSTVKSITSPFLFTDN